MACSAGDSQECVLPFIGGGDLGFNVEVQAVFFFLLRAVSAV